MALDLLEVKSLKYNVLFNGSSLLPNPGRGNLAGTMKGNIEYSKAGEFVIVSKGK